MIWYFRFFKNFPQAVVIHTVKDFSVVNEAEVDVFLEFSCFFYDTMNVDNLISASTAIAKFSLNIWKFSVHVLLTWRILSITLLGCEMSAIVWLVSSVAQLCPTLCNPMNRSTPGLPVYHHLPEFTQTHVH